MDEDLPTAEASRCTINDSGFFDDAIGTVCSMKRITVFSDTRLQADSEKRKNCSYVQQYDLTTKTWLPVKVVPISKLSDFSMCQEGDYIRMVGGQHGVRAVSLKYDLQQNLIEFDGFTNFISKQGSKLVSFKGNLYLIGGKTKQKRSRSVLYTNTSDDWRPAESLTVPRASAVVLSTSHYIYVVGGASDAKLHIECNSFCYGETTAWEHAQNPTPSKDLHPRNFFVLKNRLFCLYTSKKSVVFCSYNHRKRWWKYCKVRYEGLGIDHVCQFSYAEVVSPGVHVCVKQSHDSGATCSWVPNYAFGYHGLKKCRGNKGRREIALTETLQVLYTDRL